MMTDKECWMGTVTETTDVLYPTKRNSICHSPCGTFFTTKSPSVSVIPHKLNSGIITTTPTRETPDDVTLPLISYKVCASIAETQNNIIDISINLFKIISSTTDDRLLLLNLYKNHLFYVRTNRTIHRLHCLYLLSNLKLEN